MGAVQRRGGLFMKSVINWIDQERMKGIHIPNKLQGEPNTNMKVGCCKAGEQQVAEECAEVKLGKAGDKSDNGEHFVSFSGLNNFALDSVFTHARFTKLPIS